MARTATATTADHKNAAAIAAMLNKEHGDGTVVVAAQANLRPPRLSTGSLALDVAFGGGWPVNQWSEVIGLEGAGKTAIVLKTIAAAMAADPEFRVAWNAAESFDEGYATMLGVDNSRVYLIEENVMEVAYEAVLAFAENRAVDMIVIDSYPALVPADEDDKGVGEFSPGRAALTTNKMMRKGTKAFKRSLTDPTDRPIVGIMINQWRNKIGVTYGDPRTTPGGMGKNFWFYARVDVRRDEWIYDEAKNKIGQTIKAVTIKMKGARPGPPAAVDFYFADGPNNPAGSYDSGKEILNLALMYDIVERRGNGYVYEGQRYNGGKAGFYSAVLADADVFERLRKEVLDAARGAAEEDEPPPPTRTVLPRRPR